MTQPILTPDEATLAQFLLGTLPPEEAERVAKWVETNPSAAERLREIDARDTVVDAIDQADTAGETSSDSQLVQTFVQNAPSSPMPSGIPAEVGGYVILRELGRGGMGVVLEAEDKHLKRRVAVKLIAREFAACAEARERFLREARAVAKIDHPNVVPIHHVGEDDGQPYLVMPLLKGETLDARLRREKALPISEVQRIGREVAAGLAAAHAVGLVHRDIKPANIWLDAGTGRAIILDFGLAKPLDRSAAEADLTTAGAVLGTLHYMSPQQANGESLDARSDLFSLGAVLFHAATGHRPFDGPTKFAILYAVVNDQPRQLESLAELPEPLAALIRKLLAKKPDERPSSAAAVIEQFENAGLAVQPAPIRRKSPFRWAIAAGLLLAVSAACAATVVVIVRDKDGKIVGQIIVPNGGKVEVVPGAMGRPPEDEQKKDTPPVIENYKLLAQIGTHDRRHRAGIEQLDAAPQWDRVASLAVDGVKVWKLGTLELVAEIPRRDESEPIPSRVALVSRNRVAVVADRVTVYDIDQKPAKIVRQLPPKYIGGFRGLLAPSPGRNWLAVAGDGTIHLWKTADLLSEQGEPSATLRGDPTDREHRAFELGMMFNSNATQFAYQAGNEIRRFVVKDGKWTEQSGLPTPGGNVSFIFGPKDESIITAFSTGANKPFRFEQWSITGEKPQQLGACESPLRTVQRVTACDRDQLITTSRDSAVRISLPLRPEAKATVTRLLARSQDSAHYYLGNGEFLVRDFVQVRHYRVENGVPTETLPETNDTNEGRCIENNGIQPQVAGNRIAFSARGIGHPARVWSFDGPVPKVLFERKSPGDWPQSIALSPNGNEVFFAKTQDIPEIWFIATKEELVELFGQAAKGHIPLALSADGRFALTLGNGGVCVWNRRNLETPVLAHRVPDSARYSCLSPTDSGWVVYFHQEHEGNRDWLLPVQIDLTKNKPTVRTGEFVQNNLYRPSVRGNTVLTAWDVKDKPKSWQFQLTDLSKNRAEPKLVKIPLDLQRRFERFTGAALAPNGSRAVLWSDVGMVGAMFVIDLESQKIVWEHRFGGAITSAEYLDDKRLLVLHCDGVLEVIEPQW